MGDGAAPARARRVPRPAVTSRPLPALEHVRLAGAAVTLAASGAMVSACGNPFTTSQSELVTAPAVTTEPAAAPGGGVLGGVAGVFAGPGSVTVASAHANPAANPPAVPGQIVANPAPVVPPPVRPTHVTRPPVRPHYPYMARRGAIAIAGPHKSP